MKKKVSLKNKLSSVIKSKFSWEKHGSIVSLGIIIVLLAIIIGTWYGTKQHKKGKKLFDADANARFGNVEGSLNFEFFDNEINSQVPTFTIYYAKWCGHCKTALPEFNKLKNADIVDSDGNKVNFKTVDCEENRELAKKENINGYPTIKMYKNGSSIDYNGERTKESMENFIRNN